MRLIKATFVLTILGIIFALVSSILSVLGCGWVDAIATFATIISIVLAFVSIIYTYKSGQETLDTLNDIRKENKRLVDKINNELCNHNFDDDNLNSLLKK